MGADPGLDVGALVGHARLDQHDGVPHRLLQRDKQSDRVRIAFVLFYQRFEFAVWGTWDRMHMNVRGKKRGSSYCSSSDSKDPSSSSDKSDAEQLSISDP